MSQRVVRTRFAPSPTGFLHIGNVRTALFNMLFARGREGTFLLRSEDTDQARSTEGFLAAAVEDLGWLGLGWDEGPDVNGPSGPYRQSERRDLYAGYYAQLEAQDAAYPCFCSEQELKLARKAQRAAGRPPRYPGTCADLSREQVESRLAQGLVPALRFRVPAGRVVQFDDLVRGPQAFATDEIGDFIIRRADGSPAFFFGNALDDGLMEVTHVLRGEDHLANTPRQLLLLEALALTPPRYGHVPLITGEDGRPLSKREGDSSLRELREAGYLPEAILNYLARLGHSYESTELMSLDALTERFDPSRLGRAPARHDLAQLRHWQKAAVARAQSEVLHRWLLAHRDVHRRGLADYVPADEQVAFVEAVRDNVTLPAEGIALAEDLFCDELRYSEESTRVIGEAGSGFFEAALEALSSGTADFSGLAAAIKTRTGRKGKALYMPLRVALTNASHGPEMARLWPLLEPGRIRRRLTAARELCRG
jgi:nondiscriminating glutamyl-tRNA synthetase